MVMTLAIGPHNHRRGLQLTKINAVVQSMAK